MKNITLCLPDIAFISAVQKANDASMDVTSYCAALLADGLMVDVASQRHNLLTPTPPPVLHNAGAFDVASNFLGFPSASIKLAQVFVDTALALPAPRGFTAMTAARKGRGVEFRPNFVFLEYLISRGGSAGIAVSFYGRPDRHRNRPSILVQGLPSYSRAKVQTEAELQMILPHIQQAYDLKFRNK